MKSKKKSLLLKRSRQRNLNRKLRKRVFMCMTNRPSVSKTWLLKTKKKQRKKARSSLSKSPFSRMTKWIRVSLNIRRNPKPSLVKEQRKKSQKLMFKVNKMSNKTSKVWIFLLKRNKK